MPEDKFNYYCSIASESEDTEVLDENIIKDTLGEPMDEFDATFEALGCKIITPSE